MKKYLILVLSFFIFSCSNENFEDNKINNENILLSKKQEKLKDCVQKSPFNGVFSHLKPYIYWTFKNDGKCYYLGFLKDFFLIDENIDGNLYFEYANKLYREEALDDKFLKINLKYGIEHFQELPPIYLFFPKTLDIFKKYLKKENIILPKEYILVEKNNIKDFKNELNHMKKVWQEHSNQELNIKETLDLEIENLYQNLLDLQKTS